MDDVRPFVFHFLPECCRLLEKTPRQPNRRRLNAERRCLPGVGANEQHPSHRLPKSPRAARQVPLP